LRLFAFFFLLSSAVVAALPLPAFAAQDKKQLSEEEEIALMMEQLEQFKASWETKDKIPQAAPAASHAVQLPVEKSTPESKPAVAAPAPQVIPTIKITTAQVPAAAGSVQIKTQDGRILGAAPALLKSEIKPKIKTEPAVVQPLNAVAIPEIKKQAVVSSEPKPAVKAASAIVKKNIEEPAPAALPGLGDPELIKKPNLPLKSEKRDTGALLVKTETQTAPSKAAADSALIQKPSIPLKMEKTASAEKMNEEPAPAALKKPEVKKGVMGIQDTSANKKMGVKDSKPAKPSVPEKMVVPVKAAAALPVLNSPQKIEAVPAAKPKVASVEEIAAPVEDVKAVKAESSVESASAQDEIVIVQDEAAQYRAAREKAEKTSGVRSAREMKGTSGQTEFQGDEDARVIVSDDDKTLGRRQGVSLPADPRSQTRSKWAAARKGGPVKKEPPKPNLFAETFYLTAEQRLAYDVYDIDGFIFVKSPNPDLNTKYAVVTGFGGGAMKTRAIPNLQSLEEAKKWVSDNLKTEKFESVEIKKMSLGKEGGAKDLYWVGQKAYPDYKTAQQEVAVVQSVVSAQGGNFEQLVSEASSYAPMTDGTQGVEIKGPANFEREEELVLKYMDQLDIGEKLFGPFQGDASGESFTWQSFGETTWRRTNLDRTDYRSQVGFWTNRVVFKGMRFPMNTVDPFLEDTVSLDSTSADFSSNMKLFAGLEWRPFARNPWLYNYRPWGGINVLEWIKNFRFYVMYGERKAIKDPIEGSADTDLLAGVQIFYEWGVELPPLDQAEPKDVSDFVERYFWGEYFGDYRHEMTNFGSEDDYNSWLGNSSITMGVKLPGIPLPANPINEELMLMPYMRFEHVNSAEFSFPYQNQYFVAAGMRWMPFRNYRFKENEWLSKAKIFGEYVGVGLTQHAKQDEEAPNAVRYDLRFGVSFSSRRY